MYSHQSLHDDIAEFEYYAYSNGDADAIWQTPDHFAMDIESFSYGANDQPTPYFPSHMASLSTDDYNMLQTGQAAYVAGVATVLLSPRTSATVDASEARAWIPHLPRQLSPGDTASSLSATDIRPGPYDFTSHRHGSGHQPLDAYSHYSESVSSLQAFRAFVPRSELACVHPSYLYSAHEIRLSNNDHVQFEHEMRQRSPHVNQGSWTKPKEEPHGDSTAACINAPTECKIPGEAFDGNLGGYDSEHKPGKPRQKRKCVGTRLSKTGLARGKRSDKTTRERPLEADLSQHQRRVTRCVKPKKLPKASEKPRSYECPFLPYGCLSNFPSKNEWKRHIKTKHLQLGCWRCDMCPQSDEGSNIFNRIDLFIAHLRRGRQHEYCKPPPTRCEGEDKIKVEDGPEPPNLHLKIRLHDAASREEDIGRRCYVPIRTPPMEVSCALCQKQYTGKDSIEDWLEHVGRHLGEIKRKSLSSPTNIPSEDIKWLEPTSLWTWLVNVELLKQAPGSSSWTVASKQDVDRAAENACLAWTMRRVRNTR